MTNTLLRRIQPQTSKSATEVSEHFNLSLENRKVRLTFGVRSDTWDHSIVQSVVAHDEYRMGRYAGDKSVILDIGAHIGSFSTTVKRVYPNSRVIALEAAGFNLPTLAHNLTFAPDVEAFFNAIGARDGDLVHVPNNSGQNTGGNSCVASDETEDSTRTVTLTTLAKTLGVERFDVIKIDCEGGEHQLLADSDSAELLAQSNYVAMEVHGNHRSVYDWFMQHFPSVEFAPSKAASAVDLANLYAWR